MNSPATVNWDALVDAAREVQQLAYAPYSNFRVGAAVLGGSGLVFTGCNVENASYGLCLCAERSAIAAMIAHGERSPRAIAVVTEGPTPSPPCGMCRQVLAEFAEDLPIYLVSATPGAFARTTSLSKLLPEAFRPHMLPSGPGSGDAS
ncbi:MAG: cytidine deaminase [Polyangiaceae bacterium]|nr:cytidine deaminase [Polyangiaceae bacterium]